MKTDNELKQLLAKILPEQIEWLKAPEFLMWTVRNRDFVLDTELLHICWLIEQTLDSGQENHYYNLIQSYHASWQERTTTLAKVKGLMC